MSGVYDAGALRRGSDRVALGLVFDVSTRQKHRWPVCLRVFFVTGLRGFSISGGTKYLLSRGLQIEGTRSEAALFILGKRGWKVVRAFTS